MNLIATGSASGSEYFGADRKRFAGYQEVELDFDGTPDVTKRPGVYALKKKRPCCLPARAINPPYPCKE